MTAFWGRSPMSNRTWLIAGLICLVAGGVPTLLLYSGQRDPMYGIVLFVTLPLIAIGGSFLLLVAAFLVFGFGLAVATLSAGLIAIGQYFIGQHSGMQGMTAFASAAFAAVLRSCWLRVWSGFGRRTGGDRADERPSSAQAQTSGGPRIVMIAGRAAPPI